MTVPIHALKAACDWCGRLSPADSLHEISLVRITVDESTQDHWRLGFACAACQPKVTKHLQQAAGALDLTPKRAAR